MSDDLPMGWSRAALTEVIELHDSKRIPLNQQQRSLRQGIYPYYGANGQVDSIDDFLFEGEYILLAEDGGYFDDPSRSVAYEVSGRFWVNNHAHILSTREIPRKFLTYALNNIDWMSYVGGSTRLKLTQEGMKRVLIPIPPLNEQRRIVDKLDRIGDRHRTARNELNHIPKLIARYKQSVLAAACSGKLTEDFRLSNSLSISSISLSEVCNSISDGDHQAPPRSETGIPFITISAINDGSLSLNKATRFVPKSYFESLSKIRKPEIDDILFTVTGSIGIPVIVDTDEPFVFQRHIAILKANKNIILAKYLLYALGSDQIQKQALNIATGTAQLTIPLGGLRNFQIQLPSLEEQKEIVRRVEKMFAKIDMIEQEYQKAAKLCDRLEQATLAKAFRGELVPQDPNDEPASVLLEQVKREKEKGKKGVKSK
ncbi:restriction endonuclease subunit S [Pseudanabaena mucicola]|uniref:restriction endonuclease subunit S n=1 Tax=Pseudanabaena mucicola TaxID=71190 RepID=UPI00257620F0|nr:restriction endonuclease subunit S [Pseudanabaena mucicola]